MVSAFAEASHSSSATDVDAVFTSNPEGYDTLYRFAPLADTMFAVLNTRGRWITKSVQAGACEKDVRVSIRDQRKAVLGTMQELDESIMAAKKPFNSGTLLAASVWPRRDRDDVSATIALACQSLASAVSVEFIPVLALPPEDVSARYELLAIC